MLNDLVTLLADAGMYRDMVLFLIALFVFSVPVAVIQARKFRKDLMRVMRYGLWSSTHQTVNAGSTKSYFDSDLFLGESENVGMFLAWFKSELKSIQRAHGKIDRLVFIEKEEGPVGALTLQALLCWESRIPSAIIRLRRRGPALQVKLVHEDTAPQKNAFCFNERSEHVLIVSDVITTGTTILKAVNFVKQHGGVPAAIFVLYNREDHVPNQPEKLTGEEFLARQGLIVSSMLSIKDVASGAAKDGKLRKQAKEKGIEAFNTLVI